MIGFSDLKSEMLVNLEDIISDLETTKKRSTILLDINYLTKIHSLKHQLLFHHLNNIAKVIFELEKVAIRLVNDRVIVSSSLISMQHEIFTKIYESIISNSDEDEDDLSYYQSILNKLMNINNLNKSAFTHDCDLAHPIYINNLPSENLYTRNNPLTDFVESIKKVQDVIYGDINNTHNLIDVQNEFGEQFNLIRTENVSYFANRLNYIAKSIAADCGKTIKLHVNAKDFRVNKVIMNYLIDPLTQIIKNNIYHGIETVQERKKSGKTSYGNLYINLYDYDNKLCIEIINDGKPIDIKKIIKNIESRKIKVDNYELNTVIFTPFVTTSDTPNLNSGSGLGLSGVRRKIQSLGGVINVESNDDMTMFSIVVPNGYLYSYYSILKCENIYVALTSKDVSKISVCETFERDIIDLRVHRSEPNITSSNLALIRDKVVISEFVIRYYLVENNKVVHSRRAISGITSFKNNVVLIINSEYIDSISHQIFNGNYATLVLKNEKNEYVKILTREIVDMSFINNDDENKGYVVKYYHNKRLISSEFKEICNLIFI